MTAADIKKLRDMTGAGMMDCKKALTEAEGDFDAAVEILRKKGQKLSAKRADRSANEGVVIAATSDNRNKGVLVRLSCETDFVAKNEDFVNFAKKIADLALANMPANVDELNALPYEDGLTVLEKVTEQIGVINEKLELSAYESVQDTQVAEYIHMGNRAGVLVGLNKDGDDAYQAGRNVSMQVAAMNPVAVNKDSVDQSIIDKEIEIGKDIARQEGKPEEMVERIAMGKLNKFFKENTLLNQAFVKNSKQNVAAYLQSLDPDLTVTEFKHVTLG